MANQARRHHYIPECYLKWFTTKVGNKNKRQLAVASINELRFFETIPYNVGNIRDFNRIEIPGFAPDALEGMLSKFESEVATAIEEVSRTHQFEGNARNAILNLMALLAVRSPQQRESWRRSRSHMAKVMVSMALHTEASWTALKEKMRAAGQVVDDSVTYEQLKDAFKGDDYVISLANEEHIRREMKQHDVVLRLLAQRSWKLFVTNEENGHFITGDRPIVISWFDIHELPLMHRANPGFAMPNTEVYLPLTKNLALLGVFDGEDTIQRAENTWIAQMNLRIIQHTYGQIYAAKRSFPYLGPDGQYYFDWHFMDRFKAHHDTAQNKPNLPDWAKPA